MYIVMFFENGEIIEEKYDNWDRTKAIMNMIATYATRGKINEIQINGEKI